MNANNKSKHEDRHSPTRVLCHRPEGNWLLPVDSIPATPRISRLKDRAFLPQRGIRAFLSAACGRDHGDSLTVSEHATGPKAQVPETSGQRGDTKGKGQAIFSHWESCGHADLTPPRNAQKHFLVRFSVGKRTNWIFRFMPLRTFKGYKCIPLEKRAIFPKGRIRSPTTEGYRGQHS